MKVLKDPFFPNIKPTSIRSAVRVYPFNDKNEIAMIHYQGKDGYGIRNHYESIGGGIHINETKSDALKREAMEEAGFELENITEYEGVIDTYGLIKQTNIHYYYYANISKYKKSTPTEVECQLIDGIEFKSIEDWIELLSKPVFGVNLLVHQRELRMMKDLQNLLKK